MDDIAQIYSAKQSINLIGVVIFVFLENNLDRTVGIRDELAGNLWAIHGGGFYFLEKYKVAPKEIPKDLHWFKYEAYFTWLSGFCLLFIVYCLFIVF